MKRMKSGCLIVGFVVWLGLSCSAAAQEHDSNLQVNYIVKVEHLGEQLYHVTAEIKNVNTPQLRLDLPMIRPGIYTTNFFIKNFLELKITGAKGQALAYKMPRKQTWVVETKGSREIRVSFNYRANVLSASQAYLDNDFGFFTGVHFFMMVQNRRDLASTVRFEVPQGWEVLSTLKESGDPAVYTATDFDALADSQTMVGRFDLTKFDVDGKPHYFAATPAGWYSKEKTEKMVEILTRISRVESAIFGDRPFDKYLFFYIFKQRVEGPNLNTLPEIQSMNSHVHIVRPNDENSAPARLLASANHNYFHLWNLMRMRPAEYWPLDYSREAETPLLWLAEGFTRYYMTVTRLRAHYGGRDDFFFRLSEAITDIERRASRAYLSPASASTLSAVRYESALESDYSYIMGGHIIGALLDLSVRHDTESKYSLDDVMRSLYQETYKKGRGYTTDDVIQVINRLTKHDYQDFFRRYVWGTETPPYDQILGYAGYRLQKSVSERPTLGLSLDGEQPEIVIARVIRGSVADEAGLRLGDILLTLGDLDVPKNGLAGLRELLASRKGQKIPVTVKRGGEVKQLETLVGAAQDVEYEVVEAPDPTPAQLKLREAWLKQ
jgi:predicted metalloprotease with PDZ domain